MLLCVPTGTFGQLNFLIIVALCSTYRIKEDKLVIVLNTVHILIICVTYINFYITHGNISFAFPDDPIDWQKFGMQLVAPRYNEPSYNEDPVITNNI